MKRFLFVLALLLGVSSQAHSAVLVFSPGGEFVRKTTLAAAVAAADTAGKTIVVTGTETLSANLTVPSTLALQVKKGGSINQSTYNLTVNGPFEVGGMISKSGAATLTINGSFAAGLNLVFSGFSAGDVTFGAGSVKEVYPQWWGAKGDGVTDDTGALLRAISAAAGGTLFITEGEFTTTTELLHNAATGGPISIIGTGAGSILKLTGTSNKGLHITGNAGATVNMVTIKDLKIYSNTSGVSSAGIHLDGIAIYHIGNVVVYGNNKMTNGIQLTGSQQGEISGGFIWNAATGILFEPSGPIHSNGCDLHGVSLNNSAINIDVNAVDSIFIHSNHLVQAPIGMDVHGGGVGTISISFNHFEQHTTAGLRLGAGAERVRVIGNSFFVNAAGGTDILGSSGSNHVFSSNLFTGNVTFGASMSDSIFDSNLSSAGVVNPVMTDNSTNLRYINNLNIGNGVTLLGTRLHYVSEYADNAAAIAGGSPVGKVYRTGDVLKIVHP